MLAPMPTASTAQITGNNACIEPYDCNIFARSVLAGTFCVVNRHLIDRLERMGKWTPATRLAIINNNGSVQSIEGLDDETKLLYRTAWELKQRALVEMAADRTWFIDQSHSFNLFMAGATIQKVGAAVLTGWRLGLKAIVYYMHTKPARLGNAGPALTQLQVEVDVAVAAAAAAVKRKREDAEDNDARVSVVAFTADWCISCKREFPAVAGECQSRDVALDIVDVDKDEGAAAVGQHNVKGVPTFVVLRAGKEVGRVSGSDAARAA